MELNQISGAIVDSAMKVHTALGAGLLESTYEVCFIHPSSRILTSLKSYAALIFERLA
ncbi:MAG: GxxExxY protein [Pyrinomonadaceae bacterium]